MSILSKNCYGYHLELGGFRLSLLIDNRSGWSGSTKGFRLRFLNKRIEFPKSYWISLGKRVHSKTTAIYPNATKYQKEYRNKVQTNHIQNGSRGEK